MELSTNLQKMLQFMDRPAFLVQDGTIIEVNTAAKLLKISASVPVDQLLGSLSQAYHAFECGSLTLNIRIGNATYPTSVQRLEGLDLFLLDPESGENELRTLNLASQQLRSPVADVLNTTEMICKMNLQKDAQRTKDQLISVRKKLMQVHRFLGNMADAARYRTTREPMLETVNIGVFIKEIVDKIISNADSMPIEFQFTELNETVFCLVDTELLERSIYNLISNAIKATATVIKLSLTRHGNLISISVEDNGMGIPQELRTQLFNRYMRGPKLNEYGYGLGLGLSIVQAAATAHEGTVLIDYPENQGVRVTLTISIKNSSELKVRQNIPKLLVDYSGGFDHALVELADVLPDCAYKDE